MTGPATPRSSLLRWIILGLLLAVTIACLSVTWWTAHSDGVGDDPVDELQSLQEEAPPNPDVEREELLSLAREFVLKFNTWGPDMLEEGKLPEYAAVTEMMTSKFDAAFEQNIVLPEQMVAQTGAASQAQVYAVGISSKDDDSAELLVAGTIQLSYEHPEQKGQRVEDSPYQVRYQVSLRRIEGTWLVDNLDAIDDGYPPLADAGTDQQPGGGATPGVPTDQPTATELPTEGATPEDGETGGDQ